MKQKIKIGIGVLLLGLSLLIFFCPNIRELQMSRTVDQTIEQFQAAQETTGQSESDALCQQLQAYNQSLTANGQTLTDAWDYEQAPITVEYMPSDGIIGYIEIPDMEVRLPLLLGASEEIWPREPPCCPRPVCPSGAKAPTASSPTPGIPWKPVFSQHPAVAGWICRLCHQSLGDAGIHRHRI